MSATPATGIEPWLREVLRCPKCLAELADAPAPDGAGVELVCTSATCGLAYRVEDSIPVLLVDEARPPSAPAAGAPDAPDAADVAGPGRS